MNTESIFRIAFWVLFGGLIVMQIYFASRVRQAGERVTASQQAIQREGWGSIPLSHAALRLPQQPKASPHAWALTAGRL